MIYRCSRNCTFEKELKKTNEGTKNEEVSSKPQSKNNFCVYEESNLINNASFLPTYKAGKNNLLSFYHYNLPNRIKKKKKLTFRTNQR